MYDIDNERLFVQIPKNGSQTLKVLVQKNIGRGKDYGHIAVSEFENNIKELFAISRNPYDRLLSAVNFICKNEKHIDEVFEVICNKDSKILFVNYCVPTRVILKPQIYFINNFKHVNSYKLENINRMVEDLKWKNVNSIRNKSVKKFSMEYIKSHKYFEQAMEVYKEDFLFYENSI